MGWTLLIFVSFAFHRPQGSPKRYQEADPQNPRIYFGRKREPIERVHYWTFHNRCLSLSRWTPSLCATSDSLARAMSEWSRLASVTPRRKPASRLAPSPSSCRMETLLEYVCGWPKINAPEGYLFLISDNRCFVSVWDSQLCIQCSFSEFSSLHVSIYYFTMAFFVCDY